jgi:hypothetical protein
MKYNVLILFLFISINCYSKTYNSIKDGNFDDPSTWLENQVPNFNGDTINISHSIYFKRKNDTVKSFNTWYDLNRINIRKEGVLCMRNENYIIYSVFFNVEGQLYVNNTRFWFCGFDIKGYVSCDNKVSWNEVQGSKFQGYGFNIGYYEVEDNCTIISNEIFGFNSNCMKTAFVLIDSPIDERTSKYFIFSNRKIDIKLIFPDTTYLINSDESVIYKRKTSDSLRINIIATDTCLNTYSRRYTLNPLKSSMVSNNQVIHKISIENFENSINIHSFNNDLYQLLLFDLNSRLILNQSFSKMIVLNTNDFHNGLYILNIFDNQGRFIMNKKIKK